MPLAPVSSRYSLRKSGPRLPTCTCTTGCEIVNSSANPRSMIPPASPRPAKPTSITVMTIMTTVGCPAVRKDFSPPRRLIGFPCRRHSLGRMKSDESTQPVRSGRNHVLPRRTTLSIAPTAAQSASWVVGSGTDTAGISPSVAPPPSVQSIDCPCPPRRNR